MTKKDKYYPTYLNCVYHSVSSVDGTFCTTMTG